MFSIYMYYLGYHRFIIVIDTVGTYMDSLQPLVYRLNSAVLVKCTKEGLLGLCKQGPCLHSPNNPSLVHGMLYKNQVGYNPPGGLNKFLIPMTQGRCVLADGRLRTRSRVTFVHRELYHTTPNEAYFPIRVSFIPSLHFGARNRLSSFKWLSQKQCGAQHTYPSLPGIGTF